MVLDVNWFEIYLILGLDARNISNGRKKSKEHIHENNSQNCISYFICQISEGFHPLISSLYQGLYNPMLWIWILAIEYKNRIGLQTYSQQKIMKLSYDLVNHTVTSLNVYD